MELKEIRKILDEIDIKILKLIAERQSHMKDVADYKKQHNMPLNQPEREAEVLKNKTELGKKLGVDSDLIEDIFASLFKNAKKIQEEE